MIGQAVYMKPEPQAPRRLWFPGTIMQLLSSYSYKLTTKEGTRTRRNRRDIHRTNSRIKANIRGQDVVQKNQNRPAPGLPWVSCSNRRAPGQLPSNNTSRNCLEHKGRSADKDTNMLPDVEAQRRQLKTIRGKNIALWVY
ncbi:hypothetical protein PR048_011888 [Dryococelus australis]|uniref:Uncharacterized protein n=1 Tax=Dryococelus australis TaxID=614101 RepID=A0ABQ9HMT0_9NEOP|nr:hypothetical protein PR048_011888 [Dryococelus australis]